MSEKAPNTTENDNSVSPYEGIDTATLKAIAEAKAKVDARAEELIAEGSPYPYGELRVAVREALEEGGHRDAYRQVSDLGADLKKFADGATQETEHRSVNELQSIIDAYDNNTVGDRRLAIAEAVKASGSSETSNRDLLHMTDSGITLFVDEARHKLEDLTHMSKGEALEDAYGEYEKQEGTSYDVDKGRTKDIEEARTLADAEEIGRFVRDNPELAEAPGIAEQVREILRKLEKAAATAKSMEAGLPAVPENERPARVGDLLLVSDKKKPGDLTEAPDKLPDRRPPVLAPAVPDGPVGASANVNPEGLPEVPANEPRHETSWERIRNWHPIHRLHALYTIKMGEGLDRLENMIPEEKGKLNTRTKVVLGAVAVVGAGLGAFLALRGIHHGGSGASNLHHPTGGATNHNIGNGAHTGNHAGGTIPTSEVYSLNAHTVNPGEGWYEVMSRVGIKDPYQIIQNNSAMEQLHSMGLAYKAPELGGWGISMPADGKMPDAALDILTNAAKAAQ